VPHWASGATLIAGGLIVSRSMFSDHVPDGQYAYLKKTVTHMRRERRAAREAAAAAQQLRALDGGGSSSADSRPTAPQRQLHRHVSRVEAGRGLLKSRVSALQAQLRPSGPRATV
jgi:hypothetical protein